MARTTRVNNGAGGVLHRDSILAATSCLTRIPEALGQAGEERSRTAAERNAFEAFANRIETIDTDTQPVPVSPKRGRLVLPEGSSQSGVVMDRVRGAYRETVIATPHYQEDYAESLTTNVTQEFGPKLVTILTQGEKLTPKLQHALIEVSHTAANERTSYRQTLNTEYNSLQTAKQRLHTLVDTLDRIRNQLQTSETFSTLIDAHANIEDLTDDCTHLLEDRQATLTDQPQDDHHHPEYLYLEYSWTSPMLGDTLDYHTQFQPPNRKPYNQSLAIPNQYPPFSSKQKAARSYVISGASRQIPLPPIRLVGSQTNSTSKV